MQDRGDHEQSDLAPHQTLDGVVELSDLFASASGPDSLRYAMLGVVGEQLQRHAFECGPGCVDLGEDVDAVPVLLDHLLDPADLALDAPQSRLDLLLVFRVSWHPSIIPPRGIVIS